MSAIAYRIARTYFTDFTTMGVDHGGDEGTSPGDKSPQNLKRGIVPQIVMLKNFKH